MGEGSSSGEGGSTSVSGRSAGAGGGWVEGGVLAQPRIGQRISQRSRGVTPALHLHPPVAPFRSESECWSGALRRRAVRLPAPKQWTQSAPPEPAASHRPASDYWLPPHPSGSPT